MLANSATEVVDSQNGWFEFATHACEQHRFLKMVVDPLSKSKPEAANHYTYQKYDPDQELREIRETFDTANDDSSDSESASENSNTQYFKQAMEFYKGDGFKVLHNVILDRSTTPTDEESDETYADEEKEEAVEIAYVILQTMLDLPRFNKPFRCYRSLDRLISRWAAQGLLEQYTPDELKYGTLNIDKQRDSEKTYVREKFALDAIVPIDMFVSTGMIVGENDSFNLDGIGVVLRIVVPAGYPHYCFYENGGKDNLERSEVLLAYTTDREDQHLTHGFRVKAIHWGARIGVSGKRKTAVIDVNIEPLPQPVELEPSSQREYDDFGSIESAVAKSSTVRHIVMDYDIASLRDPCVPTEEIEYPNAWQLVPGVTTKRTLSPPKPLQLGTLSEHDVIGGTLEKRARR